MNNIENSIKKSFIKKLTLNILQSILFTGIIFFGISYLVQIIYRQYSFKATDHIYIIANKFKDNIVIIFIMLILLVALIVLYINWHSLVENLSLIGNASEKIIDGTDDFIILPSTLKELELKMNQIKQDAIRNVRIAKDTEQRKNDLIVYLAHDLKTPLTSVIGYLTLLRDELEISPVLREKYLSVSLERAEKLESLINEFFEIARFNLTHLTLELSRVNLTRLFEQISYEFKPMFQEKNLTYSLQIAPNQEIKCDVDKMQRVFDNLIRNAVYYSYPNTNIEININQNNNFLEIHFKNFGNTIPEGKLERIFEQFYRLDSSRSSKTGGSGLGLSISKEIVELHGGKITAHSADEIIEFTIYLPTI